VRFSSIKETDRKGRKTKAKGSREERELNQRLSVVQMRVSKWAKSD
jgi:hypothetical protein